MKNTITRIIALVLIAITTLFLVMAFTSCGASIQEDWSTIIIGENLPTPQKGKLRSGSNLDDYFSGAIEKVDSNYYAKYKNECINFGYTIESKETETRYEAFNANGYDLSLSFINNAIHITFAAPEELKEIEWPTNGIGALLPATVSTIGKVTSDSSNCFRVTIGNTTLEDYNTYVKACEEKGFTEDYYKQDTRYEAKNADGYRLNLSYEGCNRIDVMIQTPKQENSTDSFEENSSPVVTATITEKVDTTTVNTPTDEIGADFKKAMDSYEKFFNEYVAFMKKYRDSNGTDLSLLADYTNFLTEYSKMTKEFEEWESKKLTTAETAYYIQVQSRISQKLLEFAQ